MDSDSLHPPKLMFADEMGQYFIEYIPPKPSKWDIKIENYFIGRRIKKGKPLYYWHYSTTIPPKNLKIIDINFMLHVIEDHTDHNNIDSEELQHFNEIYPRYAKELTFFLREKNKTWRKHNKSKHIYLQKDPYYIAYKKHWVDTFTYGPNMRVLYHGASLREIIDLLDRLIESIKEVDTAYAKTIGLTVDEYYEQIANPKLENVKTSQVSSGTVSPKTQAADELSIGSILRAIFWATNAIITFCWLLAFNLYSTYMYDIWEKILYSITIIAITQVLFLTPYFIVLGVVKLYKILYADKKQRKEESNKEADY